MGAHTFWLSLVTSYICQHYTPIFDVKQESLGGVFTTACGQPPSRRFPQQRLTTSAPFLLKLILLARFIGLSFLLFLSRHWADRMRALQNLKPTTKHGNAIRWANTLLGLLLPDYSREVQLWFSFFLPMLCQHLEKQILQWRASPRFNPCGTLCCYTFYREGQTTLIPAPCYTMTTEVTRLIAPAQASILY